MDKYTKLSKEYKIIKGLAIIITIIHYIVCCILVYHEKVKLSDEVEIMASLLMCFLPILLLFSWYMCAERYIKLGLAGVESDKQILIRYSLLKDILSSVYWGVGFWCCMLANAYMAILYGEYFEKLYYHYGVLLLVSLLWLIGLLKRKNNKRKKKVFYIVFGTLSMVLLLLVMVNAYSVVFIIRMNSLN